MCFMCRPRLGLVGFWYGVLLGSGLVTIMLLVVVLLINWEKEARRCGMRVERRNRDVNDSITYPTPGLT